MMVRREVFEEVGYFDDQFFVWYADWDLCKRACDAGWLVYYLHPATAIHYERHSFAQEDIPAEEVRYKVDSWYSGTRQIQDRHTFLKKHSSAASIYGVKIIYVTEYAMRLWMILGNLLFGKAIFKGASFQLKGCIRRIQAILNA
jgi:GT2 family glycosyltransferase